MRRRIVAAVAVSLAAFGAAAAGELAGVTLPDSETVAGRRLALNGLGLREATFLRVDVYVAGLYLEERSSDPASILASRQVKRIVLHFVRSVARSDLSKAWTEGIEKNAPDPAAVREGLRLLNEAMTDVASGDRIVLTEYPGEGVVVSVKGKETGPIGGDAFARALWSVWLGPKPPNADLREGLLGRGKR